MGKLKIHSSLLNIILIIITLGTIYLVETKSVLTQKEIDDLMEKKIASPAIAVEKITQGKVLYIIDKGEGTISSYHLVLSKHSTVFSLLKEIAEKENFQIETTFYKGMGVLVESIDGVRNGTDNKYWQYWVNNSLPMVSADKKKVSRGDKVEWKFAPASF